MFDNTATLYDLPFDNSYSNNILFETRAAQKAWFNKQTKKTPAYNPVSLDYGSGVVFSLTLEVSGGVYRALNYNYIAIDLLNTDEPIKTLYAFITHADYLSANMYKYTCEIDVIQTYLRDITFANCEISRAHLPRFININGDSAQFDNRRESLLLNPEGFQPVKYKVGKTGLNVRTKRYKYITSGEPEVRDVEKIFNEYFDGYIYLFLDATHVYSGAVAPPQMQWGRGVGAQHNEVRGLYGVNLACIILPVPKLKQQNTSNIYIDTETIGEEYTSARVWELLKDFQAYVYGAYFSPFLYVDLTTDYAKEYITVSKEKNILIKRPAGIDVRTTDFATWNGFWLLTNAPLDMIKSAPIDPTHFGYNLLNLENYPNVTMPKLGDIRDIALNPKLYTSEFIIYQLFIVSGNSWGYDLRLLNTSKPSLYITTTVSPTTFKTYYRLINDIPGATAIQNYTYNFDYTGIVDNVDNALPWVTTAYAEFLAQNKNFYQASMSQIQTDMQTQFINNISGNVQSGVNAATRAAYDPAGAVASGISKSISLLTGTINIIRQNKEAKKQLSYKMNNIVSSPASIVNAAAQPFLWLSNPEGCEPCIFLHAASDTDMKDADDYMYMYGYSVDHIEAVLPSMTHRQIFNYIQAELGAFDTPYGLSNDVRIKIRQVFASGVRLWRDTPYMFTYDYENVEGGELTAYPPEPSEV